MGTGAVKTIVMLMVLVVFSILIGAQISDNMRASTGAFAVIGGVAFLFALLWMGQNSWKLLYCLPPVLTLLPVNFQSLPHAYLVAMVVLGYWSVMRIMGYVRFTWYGHGVLDGAVCIVMAYMAISYYRYPVAMQMMGLDYDYVGGREYLFAICASIYYIALSSIPVRYEELVKTLKLAFLIGIAGEAYWAVWGVLHPTSALTMGAETAGDVFIKGRFSYFSTIGTSLVVWVYLRYRIGSILTSLWKLLLGVIGLGGVLVSGWRTSMAIVALYLAIIAYVKREFFLLVIFGIMAYGGLFLLGSTGALTSAPYGLQRVVSVLPGVRISSAARSDTRGSTQIRTEAWKAALDPKSGVIKDYVWGDGFQTSRQALSREITASMRGQSESGNFLIRSGLWHNGFITYLHRLGIVGVILIHVMFLIALVMMLRLAVVVINRPEGPYVIYPMLLFTPVALASGYLVWMVTDVFRVMTSLALIKIVYVMLIRQGKLEPFMSRRQYVPLMIRQIERES